MDDYLFFFVTVRGERLARTPRDDKGICSTTASAVTVRAPWSSSSSGREHLRSSDNLDESGNFQLRREPLTAMANSGAVSPRPDIEGGRTASSAGRGNEECAARPTRPSESRGAISLNPGASRAARGQRWLNFGFYISGVARAPPHERSQ